MADLQPGTDVLDLGSGLGGPARTLAAEFGCRVTGIDLVDEYCRTAEMLSIRVGQDNVTFDQGDVRSMPYASEQFDLVWSQHMMMNVDDKEVLVEEARRVLRAGGRLALHEICAGRQSPAHFPVPWADDASLSFLVRPETLRTVVAESGFQEVAWCDVSEPSLHWFRQVIERMENHPPGGPPPLGFNLLLGESTGTRARNVTRNLEEDRIRVVQAVFALNG